MIAQALLDLAGVIRLALQAEHLRRTGLAGRLVACAPANARAPVPSLMTPTIAFFTTSIFAFERRARIGSGSIIVFSPVFASVMYLTRCGRT